MNIHPLVSEGDPHTPRSVEVEAYTDGITANRGHARAWTQPIALGDNREICGPMNDVHAITPETDDGVTENETRRRDRITIYRRKYVAGNAALKQFVVRPTGAFANALWCHIERGTRSASDRALFNLAPLNETGGAPANSGNKEPNDSDDGGRDLPGPSQPAFSWNCAFCSKLRIYEGGRPLSFHHLDTCSICGDRVSASPEERASLTSLINKHLL